MADTAIFEISDINVDLKNYVKIREKACLNDTLTFKMLIYSENSPVNLSDYSIDFRAILPKTKYVYVESDNITKDGNEITVVCDSILTSEVGEVLITIRLFDTITYQQKSNYIIVLKVKPTIDADEQLAETNILSASSSLDNAINKYIQLKTDLSGGIAQGTTLLNDLKTQIPTANTTRNNLNATITNANNTNTVLDSTITNGSKLKSDLTTLNAEANFIIPDLVAKNATGQTTKSDLDAEILSANQKIIDLQAFDSTKVVYNTNIMLNEMYCNNELLSINHNLNGYPIVQLVYTQYGAGVGGAGNFPAGSNSECNLMQNKTVYTDNNNLTIYVPNNYYFASPSIEKVDNYTYVISFLSSNNSILIKLKI
jgi:hypothetical protein